VQNKCWNAFRHLSKCLFVTTDIQFWSWLGLSHWEFFCNVQKQSWCVSLEISISETWLTSTCAKFELLWNLKNLRGFYVDIYFVLQFLTSFDHPWFGRVQEAPTNTLYVGRSMLTWLYRDKLWWIEALPHMLVAASVRPNLFFLFAHLLGSSQHHNTEFYVALKCDRNPWHRCLYNGLCAPNGLLCPTPTVRIW